MTDSSELNTEIESENSVVEQRIESDEYGPGTPCSYCGDELDGYCPEWSEYCLRHAERRTEPLIMELEALIKQWRETGADNMDHAPAFAKKAVGRERVKCADELQKVLNRHD